LTSTKEIKFNIAFINTCTEVEGPFRRVAIWFQGCDLRCPGCCNPHFQEIKAEHILSLEQIIEIVSESKAKNGIEGVTFSGGEPSLQIGLPILARRLRDMDIGTIMYTGHYARDLSDDLINSMDLVIDGPFLVEKADKERKIIGSTNQRIIVITERYRSNTVWYIENSRHKTEFNASDFLYVNGDVLS